MINLLRWFFESWSRNGANSIEESSKKRAGSYLEVQEDPEVSKSDDAAVHVNRFEIGSSNERVADGQLGEKLAFNENLLETSRTQWQFGDWDSLAALSREDIEHHPERAKLALLAAAGQHQSGNMQAGKQFCTLALNWGAERQLVSKVLIAGALNTVARAKLISGNNDQARLHFEESVAVLFPRMDKRLYVESRAVRELAKLGLLKQAVGLVNDKVANFKDSSLIDYSRVKVLETEIELLSHELSLAQQRGQLHVGRDVNKSHSSKSEITTKQDGVDIDKLKQRSVSQLGQDLWVLERTNYKKNGFFVEVGATDGVLLSNTYLLEKEFGWTGICLEPNPVFFERLQNHRSCIVSDQCVSGETGKTINVIFAGAYGGDEAYQSEDMHYDKRQAYKNIGQIKPLTTISLHDILVQHNAPQNIDYISIDTEGSEYEILSAFPFESWNIRLITVEHNYTARRELIQKLLTARGYRVSERQWDDWYEKDS